MEALAEALKDPLHVAPFLHGDHPSVVLLVNPHQERLLIIVPGKFRMFTHRNTQRTAQRLKPVANNRHKAIEGILLQTEWAEQSAHFYEGVYKGSWSNGALKEALKELLVP